VTKLSSYFPALTGIRAIAAWLVFFHHANPVMHSGTWPDRIMRELHIGVSIFFVLSGFLICLRYYESVSISRNWLGTYFRNRIARIYPAFFLLTTITWILFSVQSPTGLTGAMAGNYFLNISLLSGFSDQYYLTGIAQAWSLTVEECFYLLAPLFFILFRHQLARFFVPLLVLGSGFALMTIFRALGINGVFGGMKFTMLFTFPGRCMEFFAGVMLALWFMNYRMKEVKESILPWRTLGGLAMICMAIAALVFFQQGNQLGVETSKGIAINNFFLPLGVVLLFAGLLTERSPVQWLLATKAMEIAGKSSYVFYLIHMGVFYTFFSYYVSENIGILFILLNVSAWLIWRLFEEPMNHLIRGKVR
jgi:peptidoglycan/LPS O-acetylase OafA/YrhL